MKEFIFRWCGLTVLLIVLSGVNFLNAQNTVTFKVDMTNAVIDPDSIVGIRGSMAPLDWTKTLEMKGKNGIYTVKVEFEEGKPGDRVFYKYVIGNQWENDIYGPNGNRVVTLYNCKNELPISKWDVRDKFPVEYLLDQANSEKFVTWVNIVGRGIERGLTPEEIGKDYMGFWSGRHDWIEEPIWWAMFEEFEQARFEDGYYELIEESPEKVVYKFINRTFVYIESWGEDGEWMGVQGTDLINAWRGAERSMMDELGWTISYEDDGPVTKVTITTN